MKKKRSKRLRVLTKNRTAPIPKGKAMIILGNKLCKSVCILIRHQPPNGSRYPLVGGTRQRHFAGTNSKPRKVPENAQNPTSRVHAVLGAFSDAIPSFRVNCRSIHKIKVLLQHYVLRIQFKVNVRTDLFWRFPILHQIPNDEDSYIIWNWVIR